MSQKGINNMPDHTVNIGDAERTTQDRVVAFLKQLGYRYLGNEQNNKTVASRKSPDIISILH